LSNKLSNKDKKDWEEFVSSKNRLSDKDFKYIKNNQIKVKSIDLHGYTLDQANKTIEDFINKSYKECVSKLIIVTGKGIHSQNKKNPYVSKDLSILKYSVPQFVENNKSLMKIIYEIKDAKIEDGGSGAFYILLKKKL
jgi:DNA-nicking Smr family endonuclease